MHTPERRQQPRCSEARGRLPPRAPTAPKLFKAEHTAATSVLQHQLHNWALRTAKGIFDNPPSEKLDVNSAAQKELCVSFSPASDDT